MQIEIDGSVYQLTGEKEMALVRFFTALAQQIYEEALPDAVQLFVKMGVRKMLKEKESETRKSEGKEASLKYRPEHKQDPVLHMLKLFEPELLERLDNAAFTFETADSCITDLKIRRENPGGRSLVTHGDQREREDNGPEVSGYRVYEAFSDYAPLGT